MIPVIPPPEGVKCCGGCRYIGSDIWAPPGDEARERHQEVATHPERMFVCRRFPPEPNRCGNVPQETYGVYPQVDPALDWCGEFVWEPNPAIKET